MTFFMMNSSQSPFDDTYNLPGVPDEHTLTIDPVPRVIGRTHHSSSSSATPACGFKLPGIPDDEIAVTVHSTTHHETLPTRSDQMTWAQWLRKASTDNESEIKEVLLLGETRLGVLGESENGASGYRQIGTSTQRSSVSDHVIQDAHTFVVHFPDEDVPLNPIECFLQASRHGVISLIHYLLNNYVLSPQDIEWADDRGCTSLILAAREGHISIVQLLVEKQAKLEVCDHLGNTPTCAAAHKGHHTVVHYLLKQNTNIQHENKRGNTVLELAAALQNDEMITLLLTHNADVHHVNKRGNTALSIAARWGRVRVAQMLIESDADVHHINKNGDTPLSMAQRRNRHEIIELMMEEGKQCPSEPTTGLYSSERPMSPLSILTDDTLLGRMDYDP